MTTKKQLYYQWTLKIQRNEGERFKDEVNFPPSLSFYCFVYRELSTIHFVSAIEWVLQSISLEVIFNYVYRVAKKMKPNIQKYNPLI